MTETTATMNFAISLVDSAIRMAGVSISVKPTIIVEATASASGTPSSWSRGRKGRPSQSKIGVKFARIRAMVPIAITEGRTPNHMLQAFLVPLLKNSPIPLCSATRFMARSMPYSTLLL